MSAIERVEFAQFWIVAETLASSHEPWTVVESSLSATQRTQLVRWEARFRQEVRGGRFGYAKGPVSLVPMLEDEARVLLTQLSIPLAAQERARLCLSHDVDYLGPTSPMRWKRAVLEPLSLFRKAPTVAEDAYLDSLERLLQIDAAAAGKGHSTVFVAAPARSWGPKRAMQWLLDPSYTLESKAFERLRSMLDAFDAEVGLHGSFFSVSAETLEDERLALQKRIGKPVTSGRQHWLRLPGKRPLSTVQRAGIQTDSTLGWNGNCGFRVGMARPYSILLENEQSLREVPMVLMDGPLFDDLRLKGRQAFDFCRQVLTEVKTRGGTVSVNWHERSADASLQWDSVYRDVVQWAKDEGFAFTTIAEAGKSAPIPLGLMQLSVSSEPGSRLPGVER